MQYYHVSSYVKEGDVLTRNTKNNREWCCFASSCNLSTFEKFLSSTWNSLTTVAVWLIALWTRFICSTIIWSLHSTTRKAQKQSPLPNLRRHLVRIYHHSLHQRQVAAPNYRVATAIIRTLSHDGGVRIYLYSPHQTVEIRTQSR